MSTERKDAAQRAFNWRPWAVVTAVLLAGGAVHRIAAGRLASYTSEPVRLPVPLADFPNTLGDWTGHDVPFHSDPAHARKIEEVAGTDDYVNRIYVSTAGEHVGFYMAYWGRPRRMLGHSPEVCMGRGAWRTVELARPQKIISPSGREVPCLVRRFRHRTEPSDERVVLNYYIANGTPTNREANFVGITWRLPNINGSPAYYVATVQISSASGAAVRKLAAATVPQVLAFLPDVNGNVRVASTRPAGTSNPAPTQPDPSPRRGGGTVWSWVAVGVAVLLLGAVVHSRLNGASGRGSRSGRGKG